MNKRILKFLDAENLSQSQFADCLGVARASISHIVAGRNKPSFDFIERMAKRYPNLSLEWLITGKGRMYLNDNDGILNSQDDMILSQEPEQELFPADNQVDISQLNPSVRRKGKISRIIVFFRDGTFEEIV